MRYCCVKITPNAPETKVLCTLCDGTIKIAVAAPAEKGKANRELIRFFLKTKRQKVTIVGGETDRKKLLRIEEMQK